MANPTFTSTKITPNGAPAAVPPAATVAATTVAPVTPPAPGAKNQERLRAAAQAEQAKMARREQERAERVALEQRVTAAEAKAAGLAALEERLGKDALSVLAERGVTAKQIAERVVADGTPDAALKALQAKLVKLEEEREKDRQETQRRVAEAERGRAVDQARAALARSFDDAKAEIPVLHKLIKDPAKLEREYIAAYNTIRGAIGAKVDSLSDKDILLAMERVKRAELEEAREALTPGKADASLDGKSTVASAGQASSSARSGSVTLNGSHNTTFTLPENFSKLSDKEQNKVLAEQYRATRKR
jgi:hypothetical protein